MHQAKKNVRIKYIWQFPQTCSPSSTECKYTISVDPKDINTNYPSTITCSCLKFYIFLTFHVIFAFI